MTTPRFGGEEEGVVIHDKSMVKVACCGLSDQSSDPMYTILHVKINLLVITNYNYL